DMQTFGMIVTAEPYFAVNQPGNVVVMESMIPAGLHQENIDARYELLVAGTYSSTNTHIQDAIFGVLWSMPKIASRILTFRTRSSASTTRRRALSLKPATLSELPVLPMQTNTLHPSSPKRNRNCALPRKRFSTRTIREPLTLWHATQWEPPKKPAWWRRRRKPKRKHRRKPRQKRKRPRSAQPRPNRRLKMKRIDALKPSRNVRRLNLLANRLKLPKPKPWPSSRS